MPTETTTKAGAPGAPAPGTRVVPHAPPISSGASFGRATSLMVALTLLASAANYASNLIFGRMLDPTSFGDLTALLGLSVIIATPTSAAQTVIADRVAWHSARGDERSLRYLIRHASAHVLVVSLSVGAVYALSIPLVVDALGLRAPGPAIALVPLIVVSYFYPYALGILQGFDRYVAYGGVLLGVAVMRIAFGVPWILQGGGAGGALAGQALGILLGIAFVVWALRHWRMPRGSGAASSGVRRRIDSRAASATLAFVGFAVLANLDVVLAKAWLSGEQSGYYAALITLEKIVLFLPGAVAVVMVPAAARARLGEGSAAKVLRVSALVVASTTLVVALPAAIAPGTVLKVMFGGAYAGAVDGVLPILFAGAGLALLSLLVTYTVAINDRRWVWIMIGGVAFQVVAIAAFHGSPQEVAIAQAATVATVLVLNEALFHPLLRTSRTGGRTAG